MNEAGPKNCGGKKEEKKEIVVLFILTSELAGVLLEKRSFVRLFAVSLSVKPTKTFIMPENQNITWWIQGKGKEKLMWYKKVKWLSSVMWIHTAKAVAAAVAAAYKVHTTINVKNTHSHIHSIDVRCVSYCTFIQLVRILNEDVKRFLLWHWQYNGKASVTV